MLTLGLLAPGALSAQRAEPIQWPTTTIRSVELGHPGGERPRTLDLSAALAPEDSLATSRVVLWGLGGFALGAGVAIGAAALTCGSNCGFRALEAGVYSGLGGAAIGVLLAVRRNTRGKANLILAPALAGFTLTPAGGLIIP